MTIECASIMVMDELDFELDHHRTVNEDVIATKIMKISGISGFNEDVIREEMGDILDLYLR